MEQENAQAKLAGGLKLERGDLDALITEFEQLVRHAGYDINQELVLRVFTSALPDAMYAHIMRGPKPQNYEDWRHAAIEQQKLYTHMKNRADQFRTKPRAPPTNKPWHYNAPQESNNAMDTSPGRTRARIPEAEDFLPGGNRYEQCVRGSREGGYPRCNTVYITRYRSMCVPVSICTSYFMADKKALVDSGATDNFMHPAFAKQMGLGLQILPHPKKIFNIDNTTNKSGMITHFLDLNIRTNGIDKEMPFLVMDIGHEEVLLGYPWLATFEPKFNWRSAVIDKHVLPIIISSINPRMTRNQPTIATTLSEETKQAIVQQLDGECTIRGVATDLAIQAGEQQTDAELPKEYQEFTRLFSDEAADRFPPAREWDHAIDLKPGAPDALDCKVYPMTRDEDIALEKFLDETVGKRYIRPSKSPYTSPFFFVKKKDSKLRPVQDYRWLNSHTVRNQYPLPLIAQLISDLSGAHIFSKVDVRQGYNNIRIKKGDEWKAAFKTKFGHWEPLVMFFGLTNSPSTFQEMMNVIY
jgi:hypothetical protein